MEIIFCFALELIWLDSYFAYLPDFNTSITELIEIMILSLLEP